MTEVESRKPKVVILAGGKGTRLSEETQSKPKPMVEIGGMPVLWHIMKIYSYYGFNDFIVCLGYKGYIIKEFFSNYFLHQSNVTFDFEHNQTTYHTSAVEPWRVTLIDTGDETMTGGRIKRIEHYVDNSTFMLTYGDGVADIDIKRLHEFHKSHGKAATVTGVLPLGRFGALELNDKNDVSSFKEKPRGDGAFINGGFFVLEPEIFNVIDGDHSIWEQSPLSELSRADKLKAYTHKGFWKPMDTLRDCIELNRLWQTGNAPWKVWEN